MSTELKYKLFSKTDCLSEKTLFDYIDNKLNHTDQHTVEKHLLDCECCSDALEGLQLVKNRERIQKINAVISNRTSDSKREAKILFLNFRTVTSIAAGLVLLVGGVYFFKYFINTNNNDMAMLKREEKSAAPNLIPEAENNLIAGEKNLQDEENSAYVSLDGKGKTDSVFGGKENFQRDLKNFKSADDGDYLSKNYESTFATGSNEITTTSVLKEIPNPTNQQPVVASDMVTTKTPVSDGTIKGETGLLSNNLDESKNKDYKAIEKKVAETTPSYNYTSPTTTNTNTTTANGTSILAGAENKSTKADQITVSPNKQGKKSGEKKKEEKPKKSNTTKAKNATVDDNKKQSTVAYDNEAQKKPTEQTEVALEVKEELAKAKVTTERDFRAGTDSTYRWAADTTKQYLAGQAELTGYFAQNLRLREQETEKNDADKSGNTNTIKVELTIDKTGKAINPKIITPIDKENEKAIIDLINKMPLWKPVTKDGKAVDTKYTIPVKVK